MRGGAEDVKAHRWFAKLDWSAVASRSVEPPYIPKAQRTADSTEHFPEEYPSSDDEAAMPSPEQQDLFGMFGDF